MPYSLSSLQIDAAKRFNLPAKQVLDCCQSLYEKHKMITYPRSDNRYLPKGHYKQANDVLGAIASNDASLQSAIEGRDVSIKSKTWNDSKVEAHHAIIPTVKKINITALSDNEQRV